MNKKTVIKNVIEVKAEDLKNNIVNSYLDIIADYKNETLEDLTTQTAYFHEALKDARDGNWRKLFAEGFTMMMLDRETFEYVDQYFIKKNKYKHEASHTEIEIRVLPSEDFLFDEEVVIKEDDIQY